MRGGTNSLKSTYSGNPINITNANLNYINNIVINGKTTQASGTPSPSNILPITGVGLYDKSITFDGTETWAMFSVAQGTLFRYTIAIADNTQLSTKLVDSNYYIGKSNDGRIEKSVSVSTSGIDIVDSSYSSVDSWKSHLVALKNAGTPLVAWYKSTSYPTATTFYEVGEVTDSTGYHSYAIQTVAPLFDGDTADVVSGTISRNNKIYIFNGGEIWNLVSTYSNATANCYQMASGSFSNLVAFSLISSHYKNVSNTSDFTAGVNTIISTKYGLYVRPDINSYPTVTSFTNFLSAQSNSGTPVQVLCKLASETDTTVTGNNVTNAEGTVSIAGENTMNVNCGDVWAKITQVMNMK